MEKLCSQAEERGEQRGAVNNAVENARAFLSEFPEQWARLPQIFSILSCDQINQLYREAGIQAACGSARETVLA